MLPILSIFWAKYNVGFGIPWLCCLQQTRPPHASLYIRRRAHLHFSAPEFHPNFPQNGELTALDIGFNTIDSKALSLVRQHYSSPNLYRAFRRPYRLLHKVTFSTDKLCWSGPPQFPHSPFTQFSGLRLSYSIGRYRRDGPFLYLYLILDTFLAFLLSENVNI